MSRAVLWYLSVHHRGYRGLMAPWLELQCRPWRICPSYVLRPAAGLFRDYKGHGQMSISMPYVQEAFRWAGRLPVEAQLQYGAHSS